LVGKVPAALIVMSGVVPHPDVAFHNGVIVSWNFHNIISTSSVAGT